MLTLRKSEERGHANHGWLVAKHSFSFGHYFDPAHMGFGNLRVINEDRVAPGQGFGTHGHKDMEIITYVLSGELAHKDSMGHAQSLGAGEVQRMSAGTGVRHSEFNPSSTVPTHLLQIWIEPQSPGIEPGYEQRPVDPAAKDGRLCLIAAPSGEAGVVSMHADARLYAGCFDGAQSATLPLQTGRWGYVFVAHGSLQVNGQTLQTGDALMLQDETAVHLEAGDKAEVLVFELAGR
jgi:quercetin 2,3-dioxygenase